MKRIHSLKGRNLFKEVYRKGRRIRGEGFRLYVLRSPKSIERAAGIKGVHYGDARRVRIAVVLTRSFGKAHIRNRAKRRIRAICAGLLPDVKDSFCIIIRLDDTCGNLSYEEERGIITGLFARAGLLNGETHTTIQHDAQ